MRSAPPGSAMARTVRYATCCGEKRRPRRNRRGWSQRSCSSAPLTLALNRSALDLNLALIRDRLARTCVQHPRRSGHSALLTLVPILATSSGLKRSQRPECSCRGSPKRLRQNPFKFTNRQSSHVSRGAKSTRTAGSAHAFAEGRPAEGRGGGGALHYTALVTSLGVVPRMSSARLVPCGHGRSGVSPP